MLRNYGSSGRMGNMQRPHRLMERWKMNSNLTKTPPHGHFASVNGIEMYYEVYGEGDPLLLLHGFTDSTLSWRPYIGELAKHFRVIVPDLRGHGRTLDPASQYTLAQQALDVFALLDQLGVDRFRAIGDSGGGCSLLYLASWQPARLRPSYWRAVAPISQKRRVPHCLPRFDQDDTGLGATAAPPSARCQPDPCSGQPTPQNRGAIQRPAP